jgi:hypothetical protein
MRKYSLSHLTNAVLTRELSSIVGRERSATAEVLAHIAEFDRRRLFRPAGFSSMYKYCMGVLHLSEYAAYKRIIAARAARQFPAIFAAVADGRLHLSGLLLLSPCLTPENSADLLTAATHKTKAQTERLLAERFPKPDIPTTVGSVAPQLAPGLVGAPNSLQPNEVEIDNARHTGHGAREAEVRGDEQTPDPEATFGQRSAVHPERGEARSCET